MMCTTMGSTKAAVLPEPVLAMPCARRPARVKRALPAAVTPSTRAAGCACAVTRAACAARHGCITAHALPDPPVQALRTRRPTVPHSCKQVQQVCHVGVGLTRMSRPDKAAGSACAWMGVGLVYLRPAAPWYMSMPTPHTRSGIRGTPARAHVAAVPGLPGLQTCSPMVHTCSRGPPARGHLIIQKRLSHTPSLANGAQQASVEAEQLETHDRLGRVEA